MSDQKATELLARARAEHFRDGAVIVLTSTVLELLQERAVFQARIHELEDRLEEIEQ